MKNPQRIAKGASFDGLFAQDIDASALGPESKFNILIDTRGETQSAGGGFGPAHELSNFPKGSYFEATVVEAKNTSDGTTTAKGQAAFRISRIVLPHPESHRHELCIDVAATMGKEAPSQKLFDNESARTRYAGVAGNALQLLDHNTGFFNGQAGVEVTMRAWEHFISKPEEKAQNCFIFGQVKKGTPCKMDLLADSWF